MRGIKGFTLLEVLVAVVVIVVIAPVLYQQLHTLFTFWSDRQDDTRVITDMRDTMHFITKRLQRIDHLTATSGPGDAHGYLRFVDVEGPDIECGIEYDAAAQSLKYGEYDLYTGHIQYTVLLDDVEEFAVTLYEPFIPGVGGSSEPYFTTTNVKAIGSIGVKLTKRGADGNPVTMEQLVYLREDCFAAAGTDNYGVAVGAEPFIAPYYYEEFSNLTSWVISANATVAEDPTQRRVRIERVGTANATHDTIKYRQDLNDESWYASCDVWFESEGWYEGNMMGLRLQDSVIGYTSPFYVEIRIERAGGSAVRVTALKKGSPVYTYTFAGRTDQWHNLALYYDQPNKTVEVYYDLSAEPLCRIKDCAPNLDLNFIVVHHQPDDGRRIRGYARRFIVSKNKNYNMKKDVFDQLELIDPEPDMPIYGSRHVCGIYESPEIEIGNTLPAHFKKVYLEAFCPQKKYALYLNTDDQGWLQVGPTHNVAEWNVDISQFVGRKYRYRLVCVADSVENSQCNVENLVLTW